MYNFAGWFAAPPAAVHARAAELWPCSSIVTDVRICGCGVLGSGCVVAGKVFQGGKIIAGERGDEALTSLVRHLGVTFDDAEYFAPLDRSFNWS